MTRRRIGWLASTAAVAVAVYVVMWLGYRLQWAWLHAIDIGWPRGIRDYGLAHRGWVLFWDVFCAILSPEGFRVLGAVAVVFAALRRNVRMVLFLLTSIGFNGVLTQSAKALADRPRPTGALVYATSSAFPSGHAVAAMAGVLALLTMTAGLFSGEWRRAAVAAGAVTVLAVGFGRVALAVHYPSDVLAGWALGYLWFVLCLAIFQPLPLGSRRNTGRTR